MSSVIGDTLDAASELAQIAADARVAEIRARAQIPKGVEGECENCETWHVRLVKKHCPRCRDSLRMN